MYSKIYKKELEMDIYLLIDMCCTLYVLVYASHFKLLVLHCNAFSGVEILPTRSFSKSQSSFKDFYFCKELFSS